MRLKDLFTAPTEQKVTERHLHRVLISSICSILLCMSCLVGTTWAWFAVSIENTGNAIEIATVTANVSIINGEETEMTKSDDGSYSLNAGKYIVIIKLDNTATASGDLDDPQSPVYVLMSIAQNTEMQYYYFTFEGGSEEATQELSVGIDSVLISFSVSWIKPVSAASIGDETLAIGEVPTEPTETATTEPTTAPEGTMPPTTTESTTVPEATTTPATTEPSTIPEETTTPATTEPTTIPEDITTPAITEPSTVSTESSTQTTEG